MTELSDLPSAWRGSLLPASFNGARFHTETNSRESGRRIVEHQFPKKELPYAEDMGRQAREFNASKVGATVPVLFAETGRKPGQIIGKTPWLQSVYADGNARLIGGIVDVRLTEGHANSLAGEIVVRGFEAAA